MKLEELLMTLSQGFDSQEEGYFELCSNINPVEIELLGKTYLRMS